MRIRVGFLSGYPILRKILMSVIKNPRDFRKTKNPEKIWISGIEIPRSTKNPNFWDFGIFGTWNSRFFQDFQILNPLISWLSRFFDQAKNKNPDRDSGSRKNPIPRPNLVTDHIGEISNKRMIVRISNIGQSYRELGTCKKRLFCSKTPAKFFCIF